MRHGVYVCGVEECDGTPSGGCVFGRCWEACPSWVPVSLIVSPHGSLDRL